MGNIVQTLKFWVGLIIIVASFNVFYLGYSIHLIDPKIDRSGFIAAIWKHVGYAALLFVPVIVYLILSKSGKKPNPARKWETRVIHSFQITLALKLITGPLTVWSRGSTLKVFDWFGIPSPVERMDGPYEFFESFHKLLGYPLILFFVLMISFALIRLLKTGKNMGAL